MRITDERARALLQRTIYSGQDGMRPDEEVQQCAADLLAERVAHAATREELRRAREASRDALSWCETLAGECISAGLDDDDEIKRMIGDVRAKRDALSSAPAPPAHTYAPGPGDSARIDVRLVGAAADAPALWHHEVTGAPSTEAAHLAAPVLTPEERVYVERTRPYVGADVCRRRFLAIIDRIAPGNARTEGK